jgi:cytochrome c oxidase subunit IV
VCKDETRLFLLITSMPYLRTSSYVTIIYMENGLIAKFEEFAWERYDASKAGPLIYIYISAPVCLCLYLASIFILPNSLVFLRYIQRTRLRCAIKSRQGN